MNLRDLKSVKERREAVEKLAGTSLASLGDPYESEEDASTKNCENMIGTVRVPVGVAGPLKLTFVNNKSIEKELYVPLATTEGALVASVSRGIKAMNTSGGVKVLVEKKGASRGPSFLTNSLAENLFLGEFLKTEFIKLQEVAKSTSSHLTLLSFHTTTIGRRRFVRFSFDTSEAMGMNMVTIATQKIAEYIENHTSARLESLSSNYCTDKKPNWQNVILGRGYAVDVEVDLTTEVLGSVLKTDAAKFYTSWMSKTEGSLLTGAIGNNAQAANVIAAIFLATGQDLAHTSEGSQVFTTTEFISHSNEEGVRFSAHLPDLMVGTVGGGTALSTQKQALSLMGLSRKAGDGENLAAIIGATVVAGELSLLASLAERSLVKAHETLARGTKRS